MMRKKFRLVLPDQFVQPHRLVTSDPFDRDQLVLSDPFGQCHPQQPGQLDQSGLQVRVDNMELVEANNHHRMVDNTYDSPFVDIDTASTLHNPAFGMNSPPVGWNMPIFVAGTEVAPDIPSIQIGSVGLTVQSGWVVHQKILNRTTDN
jgi:hypothetical protein